MEVRIKKSNNSLYNKCFDIDIDKQFSDDILKLFGHLDDLINIIKLIKNMYTREQINTLIEVPRIKGYSGEIDILKTVYYRLYTTRVGSDTKLKIEFNDNTVISVVLNKDYRADKLFNNVYEPEITIEDNENRRIHMQNKMENIRLDELSTAISRNSLTRVISKIYEKQPSLRLIVQNNKYLTHLKYEETYIVGAHPSLWSEEEKENNSIIGTNGFKLNLYKLYKDMMVLGYNIDGLNLGTIDPGLYDVRAALLQRNDNRTILSLMMETYIARTNLGDLK